MWKQSVRKMGLMEETEEAASLFVITPMAKRKEKGLLILSFSSPLFLTGNESHSIYLLLPPPPRRRRRRLARAPSGQNLIQLLGVDGGRPFSLLGGHGGPGGLGGHGGINNKRYHHRLSVRTSARPTGGGHDGVMGRKEERGEV